MGLVDGGRRVGDVEFSENMGDVVGDGFRVVIDPDIHFGGVGVAIDIDEAFFVGEEEVAAGSWVELLKSVFLP